MVMQCGPPCSMAAMSAYEWRLIEVTLSDIKFPYYVGYDWSDQLVDQIAEIRSDRFIVITDDTVLALQGAGFIARLRRHATVEVISFPPGERMKSLASFSRCLERAVAAGATRRSTVVALGGGVPGNLAGFVAASLFRGVRLVHVPTTTVAAMDSVISLKQAVNSTVGKNHFGVYHGPEAVFLDLRMLQTLPERELRSGLCEAAKNCLAIRPQALPVLSTILQGARLNAPETLRLMFEESLTAKLSVMAHDAREQGRGLVLEYGHTVGHAVELCDQRRGGSTWISHGEAVAVGVIAAARISMAIGGLTPEEVAVHENLVAALGAASTVPEGISVTQIVDVIRKDNKRGYLPLSDNEAAMVLLRRLGTPFVTRDRPLTAVPLELVEHVLDALVARPTPVRH